ncbi:MAG: hypothetical protein M3Q16_11500 [Pseudomonadota bacterium]|nr:hypothetical protein [Pseudomonadota bacterium]
MNPLRFFELLGLLKPFVQQPVFFRQSLTEHSQGIIHALAAYPAKFVMSVLAMAVYNDATQTTPSQTSCPLGGPTMVYQLEIELEPEEAGIDHGNLYWMLLK